MINPALASSCVLADENSGTCTWWPLAVDLTYNFHATQARPLEIQDRVCHALCTYRVYVMHFGVSFSESHLPVVQDHSRGDFPWYELMARFWGIKQTITIKLMTNWKGQSNLHHPHASTTSAAVAGNSSVIINFVSPLTSAARVDYAIFPCSLSVSLGHKSPTIHPIANFDHQSFIPLPISNLHTKSTFIRSHKMVAKVSRPRCILPLESCQHLSARMSSSGRCRGMRIQFSVLRGRMVLLARRICTA